jgi:hypothetical protein
MEMQFEIALELFGQRLLETRLGVQARDFVFVLVGHEFE